MTNEYELADDNRESLIWTKEQLLAPLAPGMEAPPHPMRLGETERDYYELGAAGIAGGSPPWNGGPAPAAASVSPRGDDTPSTPPPRADSATPDWTGLRCTV